MPRKSANRRTLVTCDVESSAHLRASYSLSLSLSLCVCVCVCVKIVSPGLAYIRRRNYESITRSRARLSPDCPRGLPESARTYLAREFDTSGKGRSPESDLSDKAGA